MRRNEGQTTKYSAFAIIAIESVWPNPEGDESSPVEVDTANPDTPEPQKSAIRDGLRPARSGGTERDYLENLGYYKILPLNILTVETDSSIEGTRFSVSFTLDDLLLTIPKGSQGVFRDATGLPVSNNDLIESDLAGALPQLINGDEKNWQYVKDEELGLSRYRLNGPYTGFNIEDLVEPNDTITIWLYHDPSDFYIKDNLPEGELMHQHSTEIQGIIGSGDRRSQTSVTTTDFDERFLFDMGLVNEIINKAVSYDGDVTQIETATPDNVGTLFYRFVEASQGHDRSVDSNVKESLRKYVSRVFPDADEHTVAYIAEVSNIISTRAQATPEATGTAVSRGQALASAMESFHIDPETGDYSFDEEALQEADIDDPDKLYAAMLAFMNEINKKTQAYAEKYTKRHSPKESIQRFSSGRRVLLNGSHGETPYAAVKGVISGISTRVGLGEGSYVVELTGTGYEKVLNTTDTYYDDLLTPGDAVAPQADYHAIYMNMTPARAIQSIISRWVPRQVKRGLPSKASLTALNYFFRIPSKLEDEDEQDVEKVVQYQDDVEVTTHGFTIYSRHSLPDGDFGDTSATATGDESSMRTFTPINYLDISRINEMSVALDDAYRLTPNEAKMRSAVPVASKQSVMGNLRSVGGASDFYEMFVDEMGKFRYRLKFEAIERTPDPGLTPTIQDSDLLGQGSSFSRNDDAVSTLVDLRYASTYSAPRSFTTLPFTGRGTYAPGKVPITSGLEDVNEDMLSPELFRYGMRHLELADIYQDQVAGAQRKALLYHQFYGYPIETATLRLRANPSYRVGETVLVALQKNKKRSRTLIDLEAYIEWMEFLLRPENKDELEMYIGVDSRLLPEGKESFTLTSSGDFLPIPNEEAYQQFSENPHQYVATQFLHTFQYLKDILPGVNVVTPEYFPNCYWFYEKGYDEFKNWDSGNIRDKVIVQLHTAALRASILQDSADAQSLEEIMLHQKEAQGIISSLQFQNFRAASYYIDRVSHRFSHGADASTVVGLTFGQDTLVLLEPRNLIPIGFLSIGKKLRIGYDNDMQRELWSEFQGSDKEESYSSIQKLYVNQFKNDREFKRASHLHNGQFLRNASMYMHHIAQYHEDIPSAMDIAGAAPEVPYIDADVPYRGAIPVRDADEGTQIMWSNWDPDNPGVKPSVSSNVDDVDSPTRRAEYSSSASYRISGAIEDPGYISIYNVLPDGSEELITRIPEPEGYVSQEERTKYINEHLVEHGFAPLPVMRAPRRYYVNSDGELVPWEGRKSAYPEEYAEETIEPEGRSGINPYMLDETGALMGGEIYHKGEMIDSFPDFFAEKMPGVNFGDVDAATKLGLYTEYFAKHGDSGAAETLFNQMKQLGLI